METQKYGKRSIAIQVIVELFTKKNNYVTVGMTNGMTRDLCRNGLLK